MPFQPLDFSQLGNFLGRQQEANLRAPSLADRFKESFALAQMPQQMKRKEEEEALADALKRAQTEKLQNSLSMPFSELNDLPSGPLGQIVGGEILKKKYGEGSPIYQEFLKNRAAQENREKSLESYRQALTDLAPKRASSTLAKKFQEYADVEEGKMPGTDEMITDPAKQKEMLNQIAQSIQKDVTDRNVRQRVEFAQNIDKTLGSLNVDDLVQYGGLKGQAKLKTDQTLSAFDKAPESYKKYTKALNAATLLRKQVRQFYGDSITPTMDERLQKLTEPATWINNPEVAKGEFESFRNILENETGTFLSAMESTDIYKKKKVPLGTPIKAGAEKKESPQKIFNLATGKYE